MLWVGLLVLGLAGVGSPSLAGSGRQPFGDYVGRLSFDVTSIDPSLVTAAGPTTLTITGTITNAGPEALTDLSYRFQRGAVLRDEAAVRQEMSEPSEPTEQVPQDFTSLSTTELPAGGSLPFTVSVHINDASGLAVSGPGVYPLMLNVNGGVALDTGPLAARVGELHLLLTVMTVPGAGPPPATTGTTGTTGPVPLPVNVVWPLVDRPHFGVAGVFLDDNLSASISPGGRLATLVDGLTGPTARTLPSNTVTVVIDPQLLDELDRMTAEYRVVDVPGAPQPAVADLLAAAAASTGAAAASTTTAPATTVPATSSGPTGTGPTGTVTASGTAPAATATPMTAPSTVTAGPSTTAAPAAVPGTRAGTGQQAAAAFLSRLRDLASRFQVVLLPYGDPDVVALVRAGLVGEVAAAVRRGTEVGRRVLGDRPGLGSSIAYPIDGAADSATLAALRADGSTAALLAQTSVDQAGGSAGAARIALSGDQANPTGATPTGAASPDATPPVAIPPVAIPPETMPATIARDDVLDGVGTFIDQGRQIGWAMRVNGLTGVLAQQSLNRSLRPAVFTPDRRWSPDAAGLRVLTDLLGSLTASSVIAGVPLTELAAAATVPATTAYPDAAAARELPAAYLRRLASNRADVASLRQTLASTKQRSDPEPILSQLDGALDIAASTAFRQDPSIGEANLSTIETTAKAIRGGVQILSAGNSYTLASSSSPLVLTVQNTLPYDVPVRVQLTGGERVGLTATDPDVHLVQAGRTLQVKIPAQVSRAGQFQVGARLVGADGVAWGPQVQLSVESTAYGALTVIIIVVAGVVLVLMVAWRIAQRVRARRHRLNPRPDAPDTGREGDGIVGSAEDWAEPDVPSGVLVRADQPDRRSSSTTARQESPHPEQTQQTQPERTRQERTEQERTSS